MQAFDEVHRAIHYPPDRHFRVWINPRFIFAFAVVALQTIETALKARWLLAYEMNQSPLPEVYGAPLQLRVENQLGCKMVKWIEPIEFVETETTLGKGERGKDEDDECFDILPNI